MPIAFLEKIHQDIHLAIWEISETHEELQTLLSSEILTDAELAEIHHPAKQVEFFASRLCIEHLAKTLPIDYLGIKKDEHGKPFLVGSSWQMSLTHTKNFIAVVMHPEKSLGVDMEKPTPKLRNIAHKFLSEPEIEAADNSLEKLCIYWSAKEVLYKIYGKRKVIFNENLHVLPFDTHANLIQGSIEMNQASPPYNAAIQLQLFRWQGYILVVGA